ncbi:hypothetical protein BJ165DRAFT_1401437 [Panaeolus papilionaceus]|nr:hypothetical protein BJ165DRAFT_1401437 [Panaeolus papilionaceus]
MFVPFISSRSSSSKTRNLERRKGGGGGGKGGGGGGGKSSSGGGKSSGGSKGSSSGGSSSSGRPSKSGTTSTYSGTGTRIPPVAVIPAGQPFAGRTQGGAGRAQVFGSRYYGSGYPGVSGRGTAGRGFPFFFWPVVWPTTLGFGAGWYGWYGPYSSGRQDYGDPTNSTRPGGPLVVATLQSSASSNPTTTFRLLSDNFTVYSLIDDISANCSSHNLVTSTVLSSVTPYTDSPSSLPRPESVVQYYRASSISLALDGYNNSVAAYNYTDGVPDAPITGLSTGDLDLMTCLNETIGLAAPLVGAAGSSWRMGAGSGVLLLPFAVGIFVASALG